MDEWGCPACKKCHCQCHLFCDYHYDPTDAWNRDQCQKDGFDQVLPQRNAAPALGNTRHLPAGCTLLAWQHDAEWPAVLWVGVETGAASS